MTSLAQGPMNRPRFASFDQGAKPTIAVVYKATVDMGVKLADYVAAQQKALDQFFVPAWGTPAMLTIESDVVPGPNKWHLIFADDADQAGALGYHEFDNAGMPVGFAFVRTTLQDGESVPVTASHELWEMLVDPGIQLGAFGGLPYRGMTVQCFVAYETADAVERLSFEVDGVPISDFVYPSFFESFRAPGSDKFDYMGQVQQPLQILPGGYLPVFYRSQWTQVFGDRATERRHHQQDRRLHRAARRKARHAQAMSVFPSVLREGE